MEINKTFIGLKYGQIIHGIVFQKETETWYFNYEHKGSCVSFAFESKREAEKQRENLIEAIILLDK